MHSSLRALWTARSHLKSFSGTEDPTWTIDDLQAAKMTELLLSNKFEHVPNERVMGH